MEYLAVHRWGRFQHYSKRNPPWIKLHVALLHEYDFHVLSDSAKAQLMLIWLLAAQTDNKIPYDTAWISHSIHVPEDRLDLEILLQSGWLVPHGCQANGDRSEWAARYTPATVASPTLATRYQLTLAQDRGEERRGRGESETDNGEEF